MRKRAPIASAPPSSTARKGLPVRGRRRVLVATDGSRGGTAALRFGADLAATSGAALTVITVDAEKPSPDAQKSLQGAEDSLVAAARILKRTNVPADLHVVKSRKGESISEAICRESNRLKVDLVVIGSEGRDTLREWVVGGVTLRLIYLATRPVTVVRPPRLRRRG